MWYNAKEDTNYRFNLQRGVLTDSPAVEQTVGGFLLDGLANVRADEVNIASGRSNCRSQLL